MNSQTKIERRDEVLLRLKISRSTPYQKIIDGTWPVPIELGARAVGWLSHENEQVLSAMIAGQTKRKIQALVAYLTQQRKTFKGLNQ